MLGRKVWWKSGWASPLTSSALVYKTFWTMLCFQLCEQFREGRVLFLHGRASVHKARSIKTWLDEFGVEDLNWST